MAANTGKSLNPQQLEFIFENRDKMKIKDIAATLGVTPSCIVQRLKPKAKVVVMDCFFDIDKECKKWGI